jgi:hypothetical protein
MGLKRIALLGQRMSITGRFLICQKAASGSFQKMSNPDENHRTHKCHDVGTDDAAATFRGIKPQTEGF